MDALLSQVLKGVLHRAALRLGETVLDIGRGTGASWIAAAVGVRPSGHLSGLDIAAQLLDRARDRAAAAHLANAVDRHQSIPLFTANDKTPGDAKPISACSIATNFTTAVPSDGPGSIEVSTPRSLK